MNVKSLVALVAGIFNRLPGWIWLPALLTRLFVGYFFMTSGWGKIHNLATFTANFQSWGIPYPAFNAALSSYTEFLGGLFTILGLGMRFVSIPMIINMIVAILSVKEDTDLMIVTKDGKIIRLESSEIRQAGRSTQGVRLVRADENDQVAAASVIPEAVPTEGEGQDDLPLQ